MLSIRIKEIRKALGLTQEKFAQELLATRPMIANYEIGKVIPSDLFLERICKEFKVNKEWLFYGEGEMFIEVDEDEEFHDLIAHMGLGLKKEIKEALIEISKLSEEQIILIMNLVKEINKKSTQN